MVEMDEWMRVTDRTARYVMVAVGVPTVEHTIGPSALFVPAWAVQLWNGAPVHWVAVVLAVAVREPETRAAMLSVIEVAARPCTAIAKLCESRWPGGAHAARTELGVLLD